MNFFIIIMIVLGSFILGIYVANSFNSGKNEDNYKVNGIGGIFFKAKDPIKLKEWYSNNLGLNTDKYGTIFTWLQEKDASKKGFLQWSAFNEKTDYFNPSTKEFMINYRVGNLEKLHEEFIKNDVKIVDSIATYEYGKFLHIMDIEGNIIELWEPNDIEFEKITGAITR